MSRFPHLSETFILREMNELSRIGWQISLYPIILQNQKVIHDEAQLWISRVKNIPFISLTIVLENVRVFLKRPVKYMRILGRSLWENHSSLKFALRAIALFPKAVYTGRQMQMEGIQHIHSHYATHPAFVAWVIHQMTGISYSITVHAHDIFVCTAMLETKIQDAAFVAAISEYNRAYLAKLLGAWVLEKTHLVHCGIEPSRFQERQHVDIVDPLEIISIGSLQPYKGFQYLIRACADLRDRGISYRCRIIGGGESQSQLEKLISELDLTEQVKLLGPLPQHTVSDLLPKADCYVQPSVITPSGKMEGIPVSIMEALACALPVVATAISGIPELVIHDETGYLVPPMDSSALADAIANIYWDAQRAGQLGRNGRKLVLREFELSSNVKALAHLFGRLVS